MHVAIEEDTGKVFGPFDSWEKAVEFSDRRNPRDPNINLKMTRSHGSNDLMDIANELSDLWSWREVEAPE